MLKLALRSREESIDAHHQGHGVHSARDSCTGVVRGTRIDVRELERGETVALTPLTVRAGERGYAVLFRYGVVVFINLSPLEEAAFLKSLAPFITDAFDMPESEQVSIALASEGVSASMPRAL